MSTSAPAVATASRPHIIGDSLTITGPGARLLTVRGNATAIGGTR